MTSPVTTTSAEIASQPKVWRTALASAGALADLMPPPGTDAIFLGCGTSAFVSRALAALRDAAGQGPTTWAYASELPVGRRYDHVVAITRSATTTEVLDALTSPLVDGAARTVVTGASAKLPEGVAERVVDLGFADERSVVQTRFPTTIVLLARHLLGEDVAPALAEVDRLIGLPLPVEPASYSHFVSLGRGWTLGLADEAALKMREAALAWAESFPALDYRHGPIAAADTRTMVTPLCALDPPLVAEIEATGASVVDLASDPLVRLVQAQRLAVALAERRGLDPDAPRNLVRSVVLTEQAHPEGETS